MTNDQMIGISSLTMRLQQVHRITRAADGTALESVTTHTLALALLAGELCRWEVGDLDREAIVGMAMIHDLAEVYAGDTPTLRALSPQEVADKEAAERSALLRVRHDLRGCTWVLGMIDRYERQDCRESRFVRLVDKIAPKLTHAANRCATPIAHFMSWREFRAQHDAQIEKLKATHPDLPVTLEALIESCRAAEGEWPTPIPPLDGWVMPPPPFEGAIPFAHAEGEGWESWWGTSDEPGERTDDNEIASPFYDDVPLRRADWEAIGFEVLL